MGNGQRFVDPRGFVGDVPPGAYPIDYTGSAPRPANSAEPIPQTDLHLMVGPGGRGLMAQPAVNAGPSGTVQASPPPAQPEAAAEAEDYKKRYGDLMNRIGEMDRAHQQQLAEMRLALEASQAASTHQPLPQFNIPQGLDPEQEFKVRDFYAALPHIFAANAEIARAQALRASWDISPEEEQAVLNDFPQVRNYTNDSDRLAFIKRAVYLRRQLKQAATPASVVPNTPIASAPAQAVTRPAAPAVPQPEASVPAPIGDQTPQNPLELAMQAYAAAQAKLDGAKSDYEKKQILRDMREARDAIQRLQGVTNEMEKRQGFVGMGS